MKTHLTQSREPLREGEELTAMCGDKIPNSVFMFRWVDGDFDAPDSTLLFCARCFNKLLGNGFDGYIYGIQNGQKLRMIHGEEAA